MKHSFKKYSNRKIYSQESSKYVTLGQIIDLIKSGNEVEIISHKTGEDITSEALKEALTLLDLNLDKITLIIRSSEVKGE